MCAGYRFSANHEGAFGPTMDMTSLVRGRRTLPTITASRLETRFGRCPLPITNLSGSWGRMLLV